MVEKTRESTPLIFTSVFMDGNLLYCENLIVPRCFMWSSWMLRLYTFKVANCLLHLNFCHVGLFHLLIYCYLTAKSNLCSTYKLLMLFASNVMLYLWNSDKYFLNVACCYRNYELDSFQFLILLHEKFVIVYSRVITFTVVAR